MNDVPTQRPKRFYFWRLLFMFLIVGGIFLGGYYTYATLTANTEFTVDIERGLDRVGVSKRIGTALGWSEKDIKIFAGTYAQMHWMASHAEVLEIFIHRFGWGDREKEIFLTHAVRYIEPEFDFLSASYVPSSYIIKKDQSMAEIAEMLISQQGTIGGKLKEEAVLNVKAFVDRELDLLPDLIPLPAQDVHIDIRGNSTLLFFSTTYFNKGRGPLELIADPVTKGIRSDIERNVLQRIYREDGSLRDKIAGTFLWHQQHLHYHFADFVVYDLEAVNAPHAPDLSGVRSKSTFCIRDVSLVDKNYSIEHRAEKAKYLICGKEKQGISVGWGDTYFYSYVDQNLNISDLPSGTYRLSFIANPDRKFEESDYANNTSSVLLELDMSKKTAKVVEEIPNNLPKVEHIYEEQVF